MTKLMSEGICMFFNPKSTGLFAPGTAKGGGGSLPPPSPVPLKNAIQKT